jgi:hypothetical protein
MYHGWRAVGDGNVWSASPGFAGRACCFGRVESERDEREKQMMPNVDAFDEIFMAPFSSLNRDFLRFGLD